LLSGSHLVLRSTFTGASDAGSAFFVPPGAASVG
jgi:hypothetical protein